LFATLPLLMDRTKEKPMEVSNISSLVTQMANVATGAAVGIVMLNKAMEAQAASAAALTAALPPAGGPNMPAHLGQNVNTSA
jgi:hypothetical protein